MAAYKPPRSEPLAIVGSGCRFAGGVSSPSALWELLKNPHDLSKEVPPGRFNIRAFHHPDGEHHGTTDASRSYWLEHNYRAFDAAFFSITPKEAEAIDPQQRMLLEVVYEALESAGYSLGRYAGKNVAVYAGVMTADYDTVSTRDELVTSQYFATGNARSIISNRISYFFNFRGPSMTIDTACSSSLVALHQAVQALRAGDAEMACIAGANLMLVPEQFMVESSLHMLSPTGHCRMWDAGADGYTRGEGVTALFVKPLSRALADGDSIQAVIRETGANSDGRSQGITMPNYAAQAQLIRDVYRRSGLDPTDARDRCQYFEAHGTGTQAGDPNEARAIEDAFFSSEAEADGQQQQQQQHQQQQRKLIVGSIKTVIGHTEGAAGLAGLLKVVQSIRAGVIPPNLHLERLNPAVARYCTNLEVPTHLTEWPAPMAAGEPRRGSVNSFGFGGTNAHAIIEEYVPAVHDPVAASFAAQQGLVLPLARMSISDVLSDGAPWLGLPLLLSAASQTSLRAVAASYRDYLSQRPAMSKTELDELAWHTWAHRTAFSLRTAVTGRSVQEVMQKLDKIIIGNQQEPELGIRAKLGDEPPKILGIFTGQGAQWVGMSRGLFLGNTTYAESIRSLDRILQSCLDTPPSWTLEGEILTTDPGVSRVNEAAVAQPLCTAIQIALVDLLRRRLGVRFHTVVGHSSGEIAAAYAAGRLSARDAILIAYYRGMYAYLAGGNGAMLAAGLSRDEAAQWCARPEYNGAICLAASNSATSVTLSGDRDTIHKIKDDLTAQGQFARLLQVDTAYHSPRMIAPAEAYTKALAAAGITPSSEDDEQKNGTYWVSSVYGAEKRHIDAEELAGAYWRDNMVQPVQFYEALGAALETHGPFDCAIEIGPHPALRGPVMQTVKEKSKIGVTMTTTMTMPYAGVLDRKIPESCLAFCQFLGWLGTRFAAFPTPGLLQALIEDSTHSKYLMQSRRLLAGSNMPTYPWDHTQEHYRESRISRQYHHRPDAPHELLGVRSRDDNEHSLRWRNIIKPARLHWTLHHRFQGEALLPASAYCVMAYDAARAFLAGRPATLIELRNLEFPAGIILEAEGPGVEVLTSLTIVSTPDMYHYHLKDKDKGKDNKDERRVEAVLTVTSTIADGTTTMKKNFTCELHIVLGTSSPDEPSSSSLVLPPRDTDQAETLPVSPDGFYKMMVETGLDYSGPFQGLRSLERRLDFSSATVNRLHDEDDTTLSISPATLDSCFQTAFVSWSAPGDRALWTSFLPKTIDHVRFNPALCSPKDKRSTSQNAATLTVDAYLAAAKPTTRGGPALFITDLHIFNDQGSMEIQVEGLSVASFAAMRPEDDYELYITTIMDVDPEDEIVAPPSLDSTLASRLSLVESIERVASFYFKQWVESQQPSSDTYNLESLLNHKWASNTSWPHETVESVDQFIRTSPCATTLAFVRALIQTNPAIGLSDLLPKIVDDGHHLCGFLRHVARIARQIAHRFPRMHVLGITDPAVIGLAGHVLAGLGDSFLSYRVGGEPESGNLSHTGEKIVVDRLDLDLDFESAAVSDNAAATRRQQQLYDLAIVSASLVENHKIPASLKRLRSVMKPGGFLILLHMPKDGPHKLPGDHHHQHGGPSCSSSSASGAGDPLPTPPDWLDLLDDYGFARTARNAEQHYAPGLSLVVRQVQDQVVSKSDDNNDKQLLVQGPGESVPSFGDKIQQQEILLVGGGNSEAIRTHLVHHLETTTITNIQITTANSLESVDPSVAASTDAVILLSDLDKDTPVLATATDATLSTLRNLIRPRVTILWVTHDSMRGNAENAASFGFARSVVAETPGLVLQMLDLDAYTLGNEDKAAGMIAETFVRLARHGGDGNGGVMAHGDDETATLWKYETEVHIRDGKRLVPRVMPWKEANDRVNAPRRVVTSPVNTLENVVEVVAGPVPVWSRPDYSDRSLVQYETRISPLSVLVSAPDEADDGFDFNQKHILVDYSSVAPVCRDLHLCVGRNIQTGTTQIALTSANASIVAIPSSTCFADLDGASVLVNNNHREFATYLLRYLAVLALVTTGERDNKLDCVLLIDADETLCHIAREVLAAWGIACRVYTTDAASVTPDVRHIHSFMSAREARLLFPPTGKKTLVLDFLPAESALSTLLVHLLPSGCEYRAYSSSSLPSSRVLLPSETDVPSLQAILDDAVSLAITRAWTSSTPSSCASSSISVPDLLALARPFSPSSSSTSLSPFHLLDWRAERTIPHLIKPLAPGAGADDKGLFRPDRMYLLVGLTRDMGQSLCRLLCAHGARHIVIASRNPPAAATHPAWTRDLRRQFGAHVRIEKLDVTDRASVEALRDRLLLLGSNDNNNTNRNNNDNNSGMPIPIGGIVNGAMVLNDRVFAHMTADTLHSVLRPKTVGSANLDAVFGRDDHELDFFIMTSSFAAVGGHAGQSNYAAANMYMNGLAAGRRARGAAASVLNIGVVYGLGFLHRERDALYEGLRREGYPPISERDLHHMFLEAVVAGRPRGSNNTDGYGNENESVVNITTGLARFDPDARGPLLPWQRDPRFLHFTVSAAHPFYSSSSVYSSSSSSFSDDEDESDNEDSDSDGASSTATSRTHSSQTQNYNRNKRRTEKKKQSLKDRILSCPTDPAAVLLPAMLAGVERLLQLPKGSVHADSSIAELGVDSLAAVEVRAWVWRAVGADVGVMKILGVRSVGLLCREIAESVVKAGEQKKEKEKEKEKGKEKGKEDEEGKKS